VKAAVREKRRAEVKKVARAKVGVEKRGALSVVAFHGENHIAFMR
jgi:hypothetical protein